MHTAARLLAVSLIAAACTSAPDGTSSATTTAPASASSSSSTAGATSTTATTTEATPSGSESDRANDPAEALAITLEGEPLPTAPLRHQEGEPVVGAIAPTLTAGELAIPSARPTLVLTVVGSCADCLGAARALGPLADEFDAEAVLLTTAEPPSELPEPWTVIVNDDAARAFSGRDRPTAIVIGSDGTVLSRIRPFNQSGTEYDEPDLRFALQIATNQLLGTEVAPPRIALEPASPPLATDAGELAGLPSTLLAVTDDGAGVELSTASGAIEQQLFAPLYSADELDDLDAGANEVSGLRSVPGSDLILVNSCCEPAAGAIGVFNRTEPERGPEFAQRGFNAWEVIPSPDGELVVESAFSRGLLAWDQDAEVGPDDIANAWIELGASNGAAPDVAWLRDRLGVVFLHRGNTLGVAEIIELDAELRPVSRRNVELARAGEAVEVNAAGDLVVLTLEFGRDDRLGQVYDIDTGELLAEFPIAAGTDDIDYDDTATYLIGVGSDGVVWWQGGGRSGELASGFTAANW